VSREIPNLVHPLIVAEIDKPHKLHRCPVCGKEFTRSDVRQRHEEIHKTRASPGIDSIPQRNTASPGDQLAGLSQVGASEVVNDIQATALSPPGSSTLIDNVGYISTDTHHGASTDWPAMHSFEMDTGSDHLPWESTTDTTDTTYDDQLLRWMKEPCLFENVCFDDDIMSVLLESGSMPPFNAAPLVTKDLDRDFKVDTRNMMATPTAGNNHDISRSSSPPNEASEEDKWPYRWDPGSRAITAAKPIDISEGHPLRQTQGTWFDISKARYERVKSFLLEPARRGLGFHSLHLPDLSIANIFIRLFFEHFGIQMPVIHRATLSSSDDLPDPLLAAMIAIGAIYSRERHTCRFSIVLLDMARLSAQLAIELNNKLIRDPLFVYALVILCYAGLWCGNKRLFELSEVLRGAVVTYCRQIHNNESILAREELRRFGHSPDGQWRRWILKESRKRLLWTVYSLDCMFPCLLFLPSSISLAEFMNIECPCDEDFWQATNSHQWKSLIGSASVPPGRTFASAVSPFLGPLNMRYAPDTLSSGEKHGKGSVPSSIGLNSWTRYLVLIMMMVQIFEFSQQITMVSEATLDSEMWQTPEEVTKGSSDSTETDTNVSISSNLQPHYGHLEARCFSMRVLGSRSSKPEREVLQSLAKRKACIDSMSSIPRLSLNVLFSYVHGSNWIIDMLSTWEQAYASSPSAEATVYKTSKHFHEIALIHLRLARLMLYIPVLDLQNALGKSGTSAIDPAMKTVGRILEAHPEETMAMFMHCLQIIADLGIQSSIRQNTPLTMREPPEIIACFLSEVFVWTIVCCATSREIGLLCARLEGLEVSDVFFAAVKEALVRGSSHPAISKKGSSQTNHIFFAAADVISKMTPWNASLNLALLLCHRGRASTTRDNQEVHD
jgi:hypothetical protein